MADTVLITGGAGFIGARLAAELLDHGYDVRALDVLHPQVHERGARPAYLSDEVELIVGDVRDPDTVRGAVEGADVVVHLAARVGVGQSMDEIAEYTSVNAVGTAVLLEALLDHPVSRLVVASSMSVYGEGRYVDRHGTPVVVPRRSRSRLALGEWEPRAPDAGALVPAATTELTLPAPASFYALGKLDQERMCLLFGAAYEVPTVALRLFNSYGPNQALANPYTGVLVNFAARLLADQPPMLYEDGRQQRDFVSVHDVARALRLAIERPVGVDNILNVGSGKHMTIREVAVRLATLLGKDVEPHVTGEHRPGDIRHCFADVSLAERVIGYRPLVSFEDGMVELAEWLERQSVSSAASSAGSPARSSGA
jgi:dTDP-L-rhamnose 4-epimerase